MDKVALAIGLGFLAGVLAGLFGVGGGILFVPTLAIALGLDQLHAQATSLLAMLDRKSTRLNSSHIQKSRMPSSA